MSFLNIFDITLLSAPLDFNTLKYWLDFARINKSISQRQVKLTNFFKHT